MKNVLKVRGSNPMVTETENPMVNLVVEDVTTIDKRDRGSLKFRGEGLKSGQSELGVGSKTRK